MKLNQKHKAIIGALRRVRRPLHVESLVAAIGGAVVGSDNQIRRAIDQLVNDGRLEVINGYVRLNEHPRSSSAGGIGG